MRIKSTPESIEERRFTSLLLEKKRLYCESCVDYSTTQRNRLLNHMLLNHSNAGDKETLRKPHCCDICGIRMSELCNLKAHMRYHTGDRPYPCLADDCKRRFFTTSERKIHMRVHLGEKPFQCDQCSYASNTRNYLTKHQVTHSDYRKYRCEECGKSFKTLRTYKNHRLTHSNVMQFHCDVCGKSFQRMDAFKVHQNIHTDHRPYKCGICERGFHSSAARISHTKGVHNK